MALPDFRPAGAVDILQQQDPWQQPGASSSSGVQRKRSTPEPSNAIDKAPVLFGDLKEALGGVTSKLESQVTKTTTELNCLFTEAIGQCQSSLEAKFAARMAEVDAETARAHSRISATEARVSATEGDIASLKGLPQVVEDIRKRQVALEGRLAAQQAAVHGVQQAVAAETQQRSKVDPTYTRASDPTVLKLSLHAEAEFADVQESCRTWLQQDFQESDWELKGSG
eukprot:2283794-Karenia_brevis.AAC.1